MVQAYLYFGEKFVARLNGSFAAALWDARKGNSVFVSGQSWGTKTLFYTRKGETLVYASEIKGLFSYPGIRAKLDEQGLCEIFALGPARTYGKGVFKDIMEVLPGHYMTFCGGVLKEHSYWKLESHAHQDSYEKTVEKSSLAFGRRSKEANVWRNFGVYVFVRRGGQQPGNCHLCQGTGKTGKGSGYFFF